MHASARSTGTRKTGSVKSNSSKYELMCINFYDKGLEAVRDEFIKRVKTGKRRSIFVIDLEREIAEAHEYNIQNKRISKPKNPLMKPEEPFHIVTNLVGLYCQQSEIIARKIQEEKSFNMHKYWLKNMDTQIFKVRTSLKKEKTETRRGTAARKGSRKYDSVTGAGGDGVSLDIVCYGLAPKPHNKVGRGELYSKRVYIQDEPLDSNLLILIIGQMNNDFYIELLNARQPLRAIIHFMPKECAYDILVPRPKRVQFLQDTLEDIHKSIYSIRKRNVTKESGIFQQQLPVMSACSAARFSDDIFNQMSWYFYDLEIIHKWYGEFYVQPYMEWNVQLRHSVDLNETREMAESLGLQGHYLKTAIPAVDCDKATIYMYLEGLLSTFGQPRELLSEMEVLLLANPTPMIPIRVLDKMKWYSHVFQSTVKLMKSERLFIEEANSLLMNMLSYEEQVPLLNLYYSCLEYNVLRRYIVSGYIINSIPIQPFTGDLEPLYLHKYAKVYLTDDSETQRLMELIQEYPDYKVEQARPNVRLFTFRRVLNEVFERQNEIVIPTRLCFRDFTLYDMEQFLKDLITPQEYNDALRELRAASLNAQLSASTLYQGQTQNLNNEIKVRLKDGQEIKFDASTFIRRKSLKSQHLNLKTAGACVKEANSVQKSVEITRSSVPNNRGTTESENIKEFPNKLPGLPSDHPMLKGYNLGDTRQTIKTKTTSYNYEEGKLELYEERWNYSYINATLMLLVNKLQLHFACPLHDTNRTSSNYRLTTPNGLNLRVSIEDKECSKVVLNYPNGLSIYTHEQHVEQLWKLEKLYNDETRRIYTPYGAVIVFFRNDDMVLIMRYNGEVYKLYNYLEEAEEEGDEISGFGSQASNSSTGIDGQPSSSLLTKQTKNRGNAGPKRRSKGGVAPNTKKNSSAFNAFNLSKYNIESSDSIQPKLAGGKRKHPRNQPRKTPKQLLASIENEMNYLNFLKALYELEYLHLKVTTSCGHVVHVLTTGKVYEGTKERTSEWRDYFANEDYLMRSDGVKMIWTEDSLKCYHADGTVMTTKSIENVESSLDDEFDLEVSESSSHENLQEESSDQLLSYQSVTDGVASVQSVNINNVVADVGKKQRKSKLLASNKNAKPKRGTIFDHLVSEEGEEPYIFDPTFIAYMPSGFCMQHRVYAGVRILLTLIATHMYITIELCAADDLYIKISHEPELEMSDDAEEAEEEEKKTEDSCNQFESDSEKTEFSSVADADEYTRRSFKQNIINDNQENMESSEDLLMPMKSVVEIKWNDVEIGSTKSTFELDMVIRRFGCSENVCEIRELVSLKLDYKESVSKTFRKWVRDLVEFIKCGCPKVRTTYFVESVLHDCKKRGFELIPKLPPLRQYNFCGSNVVLDIAALDSIDNRLEHYYQWYVEDMNKFPRFKTYKDRNKKVVVDVPMVMSVNLFIEIPHQLDTTDRIHQFADPFDRVTFRKLRHRLNEAVLFHLHPHLKLLLQQQISQKSWQQHLIRHKRQLFIEQQRLGLYMAMLKHKVYPNYFMFHERFFGHVRNIDFFEFMTMKCSELSNPKFYEPKDNEDPHKEKPKTPEEIRLEKLKRKKCLCPKYL